MSMAFNALGMILFVSSAFAVELSVCIGVSGWGGLVRRVFVASRLPFFC
jgi:hypothetical protein